MRQVGRVGTALLLVAGLAGCGSKSDQPAEEPGATASPSQSASVAGPVAGGAPTAFAQCSACHSVQPETMGIGPSLHGVTGRKAGTLAGFAYSAALKNSGLVWDESSLDKYLEAPLLAVPGNKMSYAGLKDPAKRNAVIEYLATLK